MPYTYDYPRPALTADVVAVKDGLDPEILLIRRASEPFKDRWALPGGFVNEHETPRSAASRELLEETGIRANCYEFDGVGVFGERDRDPRGWTVSVAFVLEPGKRQLESCKAGDDAAECRWFKYSKLPELAFDHADIISDAIQVLNRLND